MIFESSNKMEANNLAQTPFLEKFAFLIQPDNFKLNFSNHRFSPLSPTFLRPIHFMSLEWKGLILITILAGAIASLVSGLLMTTGHTNFNLVEFPTPTHIGYIVFVAIILIYLLFIFLVYTFCHRTKKEPAEIFIKLSMKVGKFQQSLKTLTYILFRADFYKKKLKEFGGGTSKVNPEFLNAVTRNSIDGTPFFSQNNERNYASSRHFQQTSEGNYNQNNEKSNLLNNDRTSKRTKFFFANYTRLSSVGGETSLVEMINKMFYKCEDAYGLINTRLSYLNHHIDGVRRFKTVLGVKDLYVFLAFWIFLYVGLFLVMENELDNLERKYENATISSNNNNNNGYYVVPKLGIAFLSICAIILLICLNGIYKTIYAIFVPAQTRLIHAAKKIERKADSENFMKIVKQEVDFLSKLIRSIDDLEHTDTRFLILVDGLNSCEQSHILEVLDQVNVLFKQSPFVSILTIDHTLIIKAVNDQMSKAFKNINISGREYLKNVVQLPIYLTDYDPEAMTKYRKIKKSRKGRDGGKELKNYYQEKNNASACTFTELLRQWQEKSQVTFENQNSHNQNMKNSVNGNLESESGHEVRSLGQSTIGSLCSLNGSNLQNQFDFNQMLGQSAWYKSMSPQQMKRQLNIVSLTSRLLRARYYEKIEWERLASWTHLIETWPYRASWIILYVEENMSEIDEKTTLSKILAILLPFMPSSAEHGESLLASDEQDGKSLEIFLECREPVLRAGDIKKFLPLTINIDHQLKQHVADVQDIMASNPLFIKGMTAGLHPYILISQMNQGQTDFFKTILGKNDENEPDQTNKNSKKSKPDKIQIDQVFEQKPDSSCLKETLLNEANTPEKLLDLLLVPEYLERMSGNGKKAFSNFINDNEIDGEMLLMLSFGEIKSELNVSMNFKDWLVMRKFLKKIGIEL